MMLILLVINLNFQQNDFFIWISGYVPFGNYLFSGKYKEFNRGWYTKIGESVSMLMFIQIWPQLLDLVLMVPLKSFLRSIHKEAAIIQADLNLLYEGGNFELWDKYALVLTNMFFAITFSTGIPILIPFLFVFLIIRYWIDKMLCIFIEKRQKNSVEIL